MSLPSISVRRPIAVLMGTVAIATFGWLAAVRLPVDLLPDLSYPTLTIQTIYPDAAPISVEQFVTRPVEEAVGVIPGVRELRSTSRSGLSEVILEFEWDEEMDFASLDVREKLGMLELPREAEIPRVLRFDPSLDPIVRIALSGDRTLDDLRTLAERWLKPRLEAVRGVAAAKVRGGLDPEIVVDADEDRLAAYGLTMEEVARALQAENVNQPGGKLQDFHAVYLVRTLHEFTDLEQLRRTIIREDENGRVRVADVATVTRGHRDREEVTRLGGTEVVELALHREGSANTIAVATAINAEILTLQSDLAADLQMTVMTDQSLYIKNAVSQVRNAAFAGGLIAILVLYFFLRDLPSTVIIALSIPVSVIATFLPMQQAGVTLNIMSLGGLALGVGMLVDNSIVVLEAIDRRRAGGLSRAAAAAAGAEEVAGAVVASTLTTVSVFFPIVFVEGIAGQLFYDQAVTVCLSLVASLVVALTLIPTLAALDFEGVRKGSFETLFRWDEGPAAAGTFGFLGATMPPIGNGRHGFSRLLSVVFFPLRLVVFLLLMLAVGVWQVASRAFHFVTWPLAGSFDIVGRSYPQALARALRWRWVVIVAAFGTFALSLASLPFLGTSLVPDLVQGQFAFQLRFPEGTPLAETLTGVDQIETALLGTPPIQRLFSVVGSLPSSASGRRTLGENLAQIDFVLATDVGSEQETAAVLRVRDVLRLYPRVEAELVRPSVLTVKPPVAVRVFADDLGVLQEAAAVLTAHLETLPDIVDVASSSEPGNPELRINLDHERASTLGVTPELIGNALRRKIRGDVIGEFREGEERIDIRMRAAESARDRAADIPDLRVPLPHGGTVPVSAVAEVVIETGPAAIHRSGGARVAEITAKVGSADLGKTLANVATTVATVRLPSGAQVEMAGQDREIKVSFDSLKLMLALAIFLVYVVMAAQFESLLHPLIILIAVPLGMVGVTAALWSTGHPISVLVLIGAVMLAGIVVNNAIVLVDAINRRRRQGESLDEAIVAAGRERLRPILMTTTTTVLALMPMALGLGAGDELRAPLAVTVIGGLAVATVLTLVVIPCLYRALSVAGSERVSRAPGPETVPLSRLGEELS